MTGCWIESCGRRSDRMKGLLWMDSGFLLLYKRFEDSPLFSYHCNSQRE
ncbi:IS66 family insertion sequence element accessory protein TnpB [Eisenbergiella sp.]